MEKLDRPDWLVMRRRLIEICAIKHNSRSVEHAIKHVQQAPRPSPATQTRPKPEPINRTPGRALIFVLTQGDSPQLCIDRLPGLANPQSLVQASRVAVIQCCSLTRSDFRTSTRLTLGAILPGTCIANSVISQIPLPTNTPTNMKLGR